MKIKAVISIKTSDEPKIYPTLQGARVEFELYEVSVDELLKLTNKELSLEIHDE